MLLHYIIGMTITSVPLRYADMLLLYAETLNELNSAPPSKSH